MAGSWVSIRALHCSSMLAPRSPPRVWHSSLKNCTIWSSVVSLVMKLSRSVMMSMQMEQVSSFLFLGTAREEAEEARRQLVNQWESQVQALEQRLKRSADERKCLEERERELRLEVERARKDAEERGREKSSREVAIMKEELARKGEEVLRQREEMSALVSRWRQEMEGIQASHGEERRQLEEVTNKYQGLKAKVRRYQRHCEAKEV